MGIWHHDLCWYYLGHISHAYVVMVAFQSGGAHLLINNKHFGSPSAEHGEETGVGRNCMVGTPEASGLISTVLSGIGSSCQARVVTYNAALRLSLPLSVVQNSHFQLVAQGQLG